MVDVNVLGVVVPCQVIGGAMAREGRGSIVNVGSVYGLLSPDQGLYDFRRDAGRDVLQAGRVLGLEVRARQPHALSRDVLGPQRRPGQHPHAARDRERPARARFVEAFAARSPLGRLMDVSEAVGAVVFLASDASSYVTGANLVVDGGWSAW